MDQDMQTVVERGLSLLRPDIRRDRSRVSSLLPPDFTEFGASGRVWNRSSIVDVTDATAEEVTAVLSGILLAVFASAARR